MVIAGAGFHPEQDCNRQGVAEKRPLSIQAPAEVNASPSDALLLLAGVVPRLIKLDATGRFYTTRRRVQQIQPGTLGAEYDRTRYDG